MKQKAALFLVTAAIFLCVGCGAKTGDVTAAALAQDLVQEVPFSQPLEPLEPEVAMRLYEISPGDVREASVHVGTGGATVDEISVWKAADSAAAARIEQAVRERVQAQKTVYADYLPAEVPKLEHPVLVVQGDFVVLCVSGSEAKARGVVQRYLP